MNRQFGCKLGEHSLDFQEFKSSSVHEEISIKGKIRLISHRLHWINRDSY